MTTTLPQENQLLSRMFMGYRKLDTGIGLVYKAIYQLPDSRQVPYFVTVQAQIQKGPATNYLSSTVYEVSTDEPTLDLVPGMFGKDDGTESISAAE